MILFVTDRPRLLLLLPLLSRFLQMVGLPAEKFFFLSRNSANQFVELFPSTLREVFNPF